MERVAEQVAPSSGQALCPLAPPRASCEAHSSAPRKTPVKKAKAAQPGGPLKESPVISGQMLPTRSGHGESKPEEGPAQAQSSMPFSS